MILLDPDGRDGPTDALAARLCDRRGGIGAAWLAAGEAHVIVPGS